LRVNAERRVRVNEKKALSVRENKTIYRTSREGRSDTPQKMQLGAAQAQSVTRGEEQDSGRGYRNCFPKQDTACLLESLFGREQSNPGAFLQSYI